MLNDIFDVDSILSNEILYEVFYNYFHFWYPNEYFSNEKSRLTRIDAIRFYLAKLFILMVYQLNVASFDKVISSRGRVVKALDLKSNGVSPRRFEPCRLRNILVSRKCKLVFCDWVLEVRRTDSVIYIISQCRGEIITNIEVVWLRRYKF